MTKKIKNKTFLPNFYFSEDFAMQVFFFLFCPKYKAFSKKKFTLKKFLFASVCVDLRVHKSTENEQKKQKLKHYIKAGLIW